ncbi:MAG: M23 family peptidase, partial [Pedobacter sp.]
LELDGKMIYTSALERFAFEDSKAINSHIDYPVFLNTKRSIQKSFVEPGNPLSIYSNLINSGKINFTDGEIHQLRYIITDSKGNASVLSFSVHAGTSAPIAATIPSGIVFGYNKINEFSNDEIKAVFPLGTLYSDLNFTYKKTPKSTGNAFSNIHQIHNRYTPLHTGFELSIKADNLPEGLREKALIVSTGGSSQGGSFVNGFIKANPRAFGSFYIAVDTLAPRIVPTNISEGKNMAGLSKILFKISDNLSGLKSFNGYIDGKWVLMEFDAKTSTLWHSFDDRTLAGKHTLELVVDDVKNNIKRYSVSFFR